MNITLKILAEKVGLVLNQPFNHELKERVKNSFLSVLATYIRRSFETSGIDETLKVNYSLELEPYDKIANEISAMLQQTISIRNINYKLKTVNKVLPSIRFRNDAPFTKVSTIDGAPIPYYNKFEIALNVNNKFVSTLTYTLDNGFIVVNSSAKDEKLKIKYINVESVFEDSAAVLNYYNDTVDNEDVVIPLPIDMIQSIFTEILKSEFGVTKQEDINVQLNNDIPQ